MEETRPCSCHFRGTIRAIDLVLSGGLDEEIRIQVGLPPEDTGRRPEPYMPVEFGLDERENFDAR